MSNIQEDEFKDADTYCRINRITKTQLFEEINNLKEIDFDIEKDFSDFPEIILSVFEISYITREAKIKFNKKIGEYYKDSQQFRNLIKTGCFLFGNGEYLGIYESEQMALKKANEMNIPGSRILLFPLVPDVIYEKKEVFSHSITTENYGITQDNKIFKDVHNTNYSFLISYNENDDDFNCERFVVDSGCTTTNLPFLNYINTNTGEYNKYPYDEDNNENINPLLLKDELLAINRKMINRKISKAEISGNITVEKTKLYFSDNFYIVIGGKFKLKIKCLSLPKNLLKKVDNNKNIFSLSSNLLKRIESDNLLGLDIINQLNISIESLSKDLSIMTIKLPKILDVQSKYNFDRNIYEVKIFDTSVLYFYNGKLNEPMEYFGLSDKKNNKKFRSKRPLFLLMISYTSDEIQLIIKEILKNDDKIDGYFSGSVNSFDIYIKDRSILVEDFTDNKQNELDILTSKIISSFIVKMEDDKLNVLFNE